MSIVGLTKTFRIEYDPISGAIDFKNEDNMTYAEVLGAIEYAKMMITKQWLEETED